jgi:cyclopropane-fatty-acyl-phospholipid synthase
MQAIATKMLEEAGVRVNGSLLFDIQVHNPDFYKRVLSGGSMALGECYMDGWWDCAALDQFFDRILRARLDRTTRLPTGTTLRLVPPAILSHLKARFRAFEIGQRHYDTGNDLFERMLDRRLNYSCAYWRPGDDLDAAQERKLALTCRKLKLKPGMRLLDIGCGWGAMAFYAAEQFGVDVVGITVSREQVDYCRKHAGVLPVEVHYQDYRNLRERFDRIVSIGMFEHVGFANYRTYMRVVRRCLKPGGIFLLHTIGGNRSLRSVDPWIGKYIFPNSMVPSARQIMTAAEGLFVVEDWHSFGSHYDPTLMAWHHNFTSRWDEIKAHYGDRFYRMWTYYLLVSAGSFRARRNQLWQIVFSRDGLRGGYEAVRI